MMVYTTPIPKVSTNYNKNKVVIKLFIKKKTVAH